jgi:amidohydrolase
MAKAIDLPEIKAVCAAVMPELKTLSAFIYQHPELGYEEFKSSAAHVDLLRHHGFSVEYPYLDMPTAFRAEFRSIAAANTAASVTAAAAATTTAAVTAAAGTAASVTAAAAATTTAAATTAAAATARAVDPGPFVAFLSEYDALPGVGHGCGHNILGAAGSGAGIVLKELLTRTGLAGTVLVFGTPAEETSGAKVLMSDKGAFDGLDACIVAHPAEDYYESGRSLALEAVEFVFLGKAAHAGSNPELGINALNGVIGLFNGINAMRGHIKPEARIHGIITEGGLAANIVPERAVARFYLRAGSKAYLSQLSTMVRACAESAARAVGASLEIGNYEASYDDLLTNDALQKAFTRNLLDAGASAVKPPRSTYGSLDAGNVSHRCPTIHPYFRISPKAVVAHTREFAAATLDDYALDSLRITIAAMARTGLAIIADKTFRAEVRRQFDEATVQDCPAEREAL